jgi:hypothetical protein
MSANVSEEKQMMLFDLLVFILCLYVAPSHFLFCSFISGIYVGSGSVIHFTRGQGEEIGTGTSLDKLFGSSLSPSTNKPPCESCGTSRDKSGVMLSCLDCFLCECPLYRFQYQENTLVFLAKVRGGTCSLASSDPEGLVLHRARYILANGFGCYHIFHNNCEDFAIYCKTGLLVLEKNAIGRSGQAASMLGAPFAAICSSPLRFLMTQSWGLLAVTAGVYCVSRYAADIGVRKDVAHISVEDLVRRLGSEPTDSIAGSQTITTTKSDDSREQETVI